MPPDDKSRIEDLKRSLYSRNAPDVRTRRKLRFSDQVSDVKTDWDRPAESEDKPILNTKYEDRSMSFLTKFLIGSAIFCVIAVGVGAYLFLNGSNLISANNIAIAMSGPVSIPGGTPISLDITVTNKNSVALVGADLAVNFPAGATNPNDTTKSLTTYQVLLGDIPTGRSVTKTVQAVIFGEENLQKEIDATVTYGIKGSSSVFTKSQSYSVLINSSPVVLSVSSPSQAISGQQFDIKVNVKSNSQSTLKNVILTSTFPFGYTFTSAVPPAASPSGTAYTIGDIPAGGERTIVIHGALTGEDNDVRAFHFSVGARSSDAALTIATPYMDAEQDLTIEKPFVSLAISINGDSSGKPFVEQYGQPIQIEIDWTNNLPETISNMAISASLSGSAYQKTQVAPNDGYFQSSSDQVIWNPQTNPDFTSVAAGATGRLNFSITPTDTGTAAKPVINPEIDIAGSASADRTQASGVPTQTSPVVKAVKISSGISLSGQIVRSQGPFANTGPMPPKADQKTTYTVIWTVSNTSNEVDNAQVTATLPPYVTWVGQTSPSSENVIYDQPTGTITWNVGTLKVYSSGSAQRRQLSFQISFEPSVSQIGQIPNLINPATLTGTDNWTAATLESTQNYLTTSYSTDPTFKRGDEVVVQ